MISRSLFSRGLVAAGLAAAAAPSLRACSECGCSLSSDWSAQGYPQQPGLQAGARFEYYDSRDLRTGRGVVPDSDRVLPADTELQRETLNRNTWLVLDAVGENGWSVGAQLPYHVRSHSTIAPGDTVISESRAAGLGDLRLVGRYQHGGLYRAFGVQWGVKLPTGGFHQTFATGPQAGEPLDRGLQLGSGTTDLLLGVSCFRRFGAQIGTFAQVLGQVPVRPREAFLPSANLAVNAGVRYLNRTRVTPQIQVNARWDGREHGAEADGPNSGAARVYVSPGITVELGSRATLFAFVQLPVYRRLNGYQLEPRSLWSVGCTLRR